MATQSNKPWYKRPLVLISLSAGFVGLAAGGLWLYRRVKNNADDLDSAKAGVDFDQITSSGNPNKALPPASYSASQNQGNSSGAVFPLQFNSRGKEVKQLQQAIITKFTRDALPKYGADGHWGSETQRFFEKNTELETVIDKDTFLRYVSGDFSKKGSAASTSSTNSGQYNSISDYAKAVIPSWVRDPFIITGWSLWDAAMLKNINAVIALLQKLKTTANYSSASQGFQLRPFRLPMRRYTLVSGLMEAFEGQAANKEKIRAELRRMGLKETVKNNDPANYDSSWALSGIGGGIARLVRTTMSAILTDGFDVRVAVPARTLIGRWVSSGNGFTRILTFDGRTIYVRTNAVQLI
ncbi:MAG: hypothetical protein MUC87_20845 [Bacteroidia bacterium]|jgi:hypothetical protein|nr:hypothetical protein [Bacteroidia bacterium]